MFYLSDYPTVADIFKSVNANAKSVLEFNKVYKLKIERKVIKI